MLVTPLSRPDRLRFFVTALRTTRLLGNHPYGGEWLRNPESQSDLLRSLCQCRLSCRRASGSSFNDLFGHGDEIVEDIRHAAVGRFPRPQQTLDEFRVVIMCHDVEDAEYVRAATAMTQREWDEIRSAAQLGCAVAGLGEGQPDFRAGIVVSVKDGVVTTIYLTCGDTALFTITLRRNNEIWIPNGSGMNRACY